MRIPVKVLAATTMLLLGQTAFAAAKEQCFPGTVEKPLESEIIFSTSGGSYADTMREVFWKKFEEICGVKVIPYNTPGRTLSQSVTLIRSGNVPFDIFNTLSPQQFSLAIKEDVLQKLPAGIWNGVSDKMVPKSFNEYGVWGAPYSTVLIYSKKAFPNGIKSWADFWDVKQFPGPRIMQDDPSNIVFALLATGMAPKDIYPITPDKIEKAFAKLDEIRPHVRTFWKAGDQPVQGVGNGEFVAGTTWSGRAIIGQKQGLPIGITWKGNLLNVSWFMIPKGAKSPRAAAALLRFMQNPEYQAEYARRMNYSGTRVEVASLVSPEVYENMPTNPKNLAEATVLDADWWAANEAATSAAWAAWVATGKYKN